MERSVTCGSRQPNLITKPQLGSAITRLAVNSKTIARSCLSAVQIRRRFISINLVICIKVKRSLTQAQFSLRKGDFNSRFAEKSFDTKVDVAADLRVQPRPVSPNQQAKIQRPIGKFQKLNFWWWISQDVVYSFS